MFGKILIRNRPIIVLVAAMSLTFWACLPNPKPPPDDKCPESTKSWLAHPSDVFAWEWDDPQDGNYYWKLTEGTALMSPSFSTYLDASKGIAFDMFIRAHQNGLFQGSETIGVMYILEYTFPEAPCDVTLTWDTALSLSLPQGFCVTVGSWSATCVEVPDYKYGDFQFIVIEDGTGTVRVSGSGQPLLLGKMYDAISHMPASGMALYVENNFQGPMGLSKTVNGSILVQGGVQGRIFLGVAAQLMIPHNGMACIENCVTERIENYLDTAVFMVGKGTEMVVDWEMNPAPK
ncbi:MAG: hypothetical protein OEZ02_02035 [Anaerolineae bacterium]|nr:hypothetical protein [Anaerolineae bacterium]